VIATNVLGTSEGPERTFTTKQEAAFALPDQRAWEMVTPENKHGAPVEALTREGGVILAAEDGDSITYVADGSVVEEPQGNRSPEDQQIMATRTPEGWRSEDIATPQTKAEGVSAGQAPEYRFFTPDLSLALVQPWGTEPPLTSETTHTTMYLRDDATGAYKALVTEANLAPGAALEDQLHFVDATPDLSSVVFVSTVALTGHTSGPGLYDWHAGALLFVSDLPDGVPAREPELGYYNVAASAISSGGSRIIWTNKEENSGRGHLYMTDTYSGQTLQIDAAQGAAEPSGVGSAQFQSASADGSRVFFTDRQRLTAESTAEPGQVGETGRPDLYECEIVEAAGRPACDLKDLTIDHSEGDHGADVQNFLLGASEEGSTIYFIAQGVLAVNENANGEQAEGGRDNLYELHSDGAGWTRTFIATLSNEDGPEWEGSKQANTSYLTARVSPDGRYLAFMSAASLTGYDNVDVNPEAKGAHDEEVYLYDSATASLRCVSCNPTGERPSGVLDTEEAGEGLGLLVDRREVWAGHWLAGNVPGWTAQSLLSALYQSRYLTNEGRLFFNSPDDLVSQAINGKEDVYEYEPSGVGGCESPTGGCVSLISGGSSDRESAFIEATPSGNDVFFITEEQLLPQDTDTAFDIYDARVCTDASPCLTPPTPAPAACDSDAACRPAAPAQPSTVGPAGTAIVSGPGNQTAPKSAPTAEVKSVKQSARPLTRAERLASALKLCRREHPHSRGKRASCEANARKRYAPRKANAHLRKHAHHMSSSRRTVR
jgi:hypothetical protein